MKEVLRYDFSPFLQKNVILGILHLTRSWIVSLMILHLLKRISLETFIMLLSLEKKNCLVCSLLL